MQPQDPGDIGLSGQMRLARIEQLLDRMDSKMDVATVAASEAARLAKDVQVVANAEIVDLKSRVRQLELRFYGILAGLLTAIGVLVYNGKAG